MRFKEFSKIKKRYDHHYGYDPELLVYKHKIGPIYGKKNLKVPHAKYSISKRASKLMKNKQQYEDLRNCIN